MIMGLMTVLATIWALIALVITFIMYMLDRIGKAIEKAFRDGAKR